MKNILFAITILFGINLSCTAQLQNHEVKLNGKIKSLTIKTTGIPYDEINDIVFYSGYDESGKKIKESYKMEGMMLEENREFVYDTSGNLIEVKLFFREEYRGGIKYQFNAMNQLISEIEYKDTAMIAAHRYTYENGRVLTKESSDDGINWPQKSVYTYNENGMRTSESVHNNGVILVRFIYSYDSKGNCIEEKYESFIDQESNTIFKYKFDKNGYVTEIRKYDPKNKPLSHILITYDLKGNKTSETEFDSKGKAVNKDTWVYETDAKGNTIKETLLRNGVATLVVETTIEYYE